MREYLSRLPYEIRDLVHRASGLARETNLSAYIVGGLVRDLLLGFKNFDLDIVVERDGIRFAEKFAAILKARLIRHRRFGTATVICRCGLKVDIATARREYYPQAGGLPVVSPGTLEDDLLRRDFTINAMAISINRADFGRIIDLFDGRSDLRDKKIRILHDLSFIDDPTRILRAIRFEKRYSFSIEANTLRLLKEASRKNMLGEVEPQRLRRELILALQEEHPITQLKRLKSLAGLGFIIPRLSLTEDTLRLLRSIEKQILWFEATCPRRRHLDSWLIYFMGLISHLGMLQVKAICKKFVFCRGEEKRILSYKKISLLLITTLSRKRVKPSRIFGLLEPLSYEVIILLRARYKKRSLRRYIEEFLRDYNGMLPYASGEDLNKLGVKPGPCYQLIFNNVLKARLDGRVKTRKEEILLIKKLIKGRWSSLS